MSRKKHTKTYEIGRVLSSQTIGVEFASKVVKVGSGSRRKRIKLQLWDTAGTERFRAVSRSYYRGAAGALLIYDISNHATFRALGTFLDDARALASPNLTVIMAGNKRDLGEEEDVGDNESIAETITAASTFTAESFDSRVSGFPTASVASSMRSGLGSRNTRTVAPEGREVLATEASRWADSQGIPVAVEISALTGDEVEDVFRRLAGMILTKIELGEIDPDDPQSGIQYGDSGNWMTSGVSDGASIKSVLTVDDGLPVRRRARNTGGWVSGLREWEEVFRLDGRRRNRCC